MAQCDWKISEVDVMAIFALSEEVNLRYWQQLSYSLLLLLWLFAAKNTFHAWIAVGSYFDV